MGNVRRYDPTPPPPADIDLDKFPLKLVTLETDASKKGWSRYKFSLSNEVRSRHLQDPIHSQQWKDLITDFDRKLLDQNSFCSRC